MKILLLALAVIFLETSGALAKAQPVTWTGSAVGGYHEAFSMAGWLYTNMVQVASNPGWGTKPNNFGGYNVTYTGEDSNHIVCFSQYLNQLDGQWICQISNNTISDGPLARKLVSQLLQHEPQNQTFPVNTGTFTAKEDGRSIMFLVKYSDGNAQGVKCIYTAVQGDITSAECLFK